METIAGATDRLLKYGVCRGAKPFAGSLRACPEPAEGVSLRYNCSSFLYRKESEEGHEELFRSLLKDTP